MDTLFWTRCNPNTIAFKPTTKKFFDKFLYKIVVYCPAGRLILSDNDLVDELARRKEMNKHINYGGYWGAGSNKDLEYASIPLLEKLRYIKLSSSPKVKFRVEEPGIQIYAETEDQLKQVVNQLDPAWKSNIREVFGPEDAESESFLNSGAILRKTDIGFKYKVLLKDGRYTGETKLQLKTYLGNLGCDTIKVSKTGLDMLSRPTGFIWNLYFYTNDLNILTFLNLICPGIVSNFHELVVATDK